MNLKELLANASELVSKGYTPSVEAFSHPLIGHTFKEDQGTLFKVLDADEWTCKIVVWWEGETDTWHMLTNRYLIEKGIKDGSTKEQS